MNPIKAKALDYLARREHSPKELQTKLEQFFEDKDAIQTALTELTQEGLLNPKRFIESRVRHRLHQGYGRLRIMQELSQVHGCSRTEIQAAFDSLPQEDTESELSQLEQLIQKKYPDFDPQDKQESAKIIKKLLQRGFSYDLIKQIRIHEK